MPAGVAGLVFAILSNNDFSAGRYQSAVKNSTIAMWCNIGGLIGGIIILVYFLLVFGGALLENM
jgi:hypothetical protein